MAPRRVQIDYNRVMALKRDGLTVIEISEIIGVKYRTLTRNLNRVNKSDFKMNRAISDYELLEKVDRINNRFPDFGSYQTWCSLKKEGCFVKRERVELMMKIVDPEGVLRRTMEMRKISRIPYSVPHSHYLWHIDCYLKLGPYKLVIRGGIDGWSRTVVFLEVGTRNGSENMLAAFKVGVAKYTTPLRVRSDKGKEMTGVARFIRMARPDDPKCIITGRSVRNVKIERYWGDLRKFCVGKYIRWFRELENTRDLDISDPVDLACLHAVFLVPLREDLQKFQSYYNSHRIRTLHRKSPVALLHVAPMPRELVVSEPDIQLQEYVNDPDLDEGAASAVGGVDFNTCFIPEHISMAACAVHRDHVANLELGLGQQYKKLRDHLQNLHRFCPHCTNGQVN